MYAGKHAFLYAIGAGLFNLGPDLLVRHAFGVPSGKGHDAVGAVAVAAVLGFDEKPVPFQADFRGKIFWQSFYRFY